MGDSPRVAVLARAVRPLHGVGGLERHVYDLVRHLTRRGARVTLITRPASLAVSSEHPARLFDLDPDRFRLVTVPYVTFPGAGRRGTTILDRSTAYPIFGWRAGRVAVKLARRGDVDVVHALGASGLGYALARRRPEPTVPFVFNPQGLEEFGGTEASFSSLKRAAYTPLQMVVRACARAADAVIATDRSLVGTVQRHLNLPSSAIVIVPNAVDLDAIDRESVAGAAEDVRRAAGIDPHVPVILSVGRLEENKGFHVLARALGLLDSSGRSGPWRWVLVGDGPYAAAILRTAESAGIGSRMIVRGRVDDGELAAWYGAADVFAHPTLYEGSSLVTLEAMARGKAVVATRAGGLPDKVVPGVTGWLVEPHQPDALAAALAEALESAAERERRGRAGRALVEREFAWPAVADRMLALYARLSADDPSDHDAGWRRTRQ